MLGSESTVVLSREIYVTAALAGATIFVAMAGLNFEREIALGAGLSVGFLVRGLALQWGWSLPRYRERAGRSLDEINRLD